MILFCPLGVIRCWWEDGRPTCQGDVSFLYDRKVSSYLEMAIKRDEHKKASVYSCWPQGSVSDRVKTCSFVANNSGKKDIPNLQSCIQNSILILFINFTVNCFNSFLFNYCTLVPLPCV